MNPELKNHILQILDAAAGIPGHPLLSARARDAAMRMRAETSRRTTTASMTEHCLKYGQDFCEVGGRTVHCVRKVVPPPGLGRSTYRIAWRIGGERASRKAVAKLLGEA